LKGSNESVVTVLDNDSYAGIGLNQNKLIALHSRLINLKQDNPAAYELRIEREAIMVVGGHSALCAHIWMDSNPDLYGDIKAMEALKR